MKAPKQSRPTAEGHKGQTRQPFLQRKPGAAADRPFIASPTAPQIQLKLTVNQPGDRYEQEADHMAERVMRMPSENVAPPMISRMRAGEPVQRKCAACEAGGTTCSSCAAKEKEKAIQRQSTSSEPTHAPDTLAQRLQARSGQGAPLSPTVHQQMGGAFGQDFSGVRLHTDAEAVQMSRELNAQAFTYGQDIYFGSGKYQPETTEGRGLLGHELTHTVQQGGDRADAIKLKKGTKENPKPSSEVLAKWNSKQKNSETITFLKSIISSGNARMFNEEHLNSFFRLIFQDDPMLDSFINELSIEQKFKAKEIIYGGQDNLVIAQFAKFSKYELFPSEIQDQLAPDVTNRGLFLQFQFFDPDFFTSSNNPLLQFIRPPKSNKIKSAQSQMQMNNASGFIVSLQCFIYFPAISKSLKAKARQYLLGNVNKTGAESALLEYTQMFGLHQENRNFNFVKAFDEGNISVGIDQIDAEYETMTDWKTGELYEQPMVIFTRSLKIESNNKILYLDVIGTCLSTTFRDIESIQKLNFKAKLNVKGDISVSLLISGSSDGVFNEKYSYKKDRSTLYASLKDIDPDITPFLINDVSNIDSGALLSLEGYTNFILKNSSSFLIGRKVNIPGIVSWDASPHAPVRLFIPTQPDQYSPVIERLEFNSKIDVLEEILDATGNIEYYKIMTPHGEVGFVEGNKISTNMPDSDAQLFRVPSGVNGYAISIAEAYYRNNVIMRLDLRHLVEALHFVNFGVWPEEWNIVSFQASQLIWIPSAYHAQALVAQKRNERLEDIIIQHFKGGGTYALNASAMGKYLFKMAWSSTQFYPIVINLLNEIGDLDDELAVAFVNEAAKPQNAGAAEIPFTGLDRFLMSKEGERMVDELYMALVTGYLNDSDEAAAMHILATKTRHISIETFSQQIDNAMVFPLKMVGLTVVDAAPLHASKNSNGMVVPDYPVAVGADYPEDIRNIRAHGRGSPFLKEIELAPNELVGVKLYDEGGSIHYIPASGLLMYSEKTTRATLGKILEVSSLVIGVGVAGKAATSIGKVLLWADRAAAAIGVLSSIINEHRGWFIKNFGESGKSFISAVNKVNLAASVYGITRLVTGIGYGLVRNTKKQSNDWEKDAIDAGLINDSRVVSLKQNTNDLIESVEDGRLSILKSQNSRPLNRVPQDKLESMAKAGDQSASAELISRDISQQFKTEADFLAYTRGKPSAELDRVEAHIEWEIADVKGKKTTLADGTEEISFNGHDWRKSPGPTGEWCRHSGQPSCFPSVGKNDKLPTQDELANLPNEENVHPIFSSAERPVYSIAGFNERGFYGRTHPDKPFYAVRVGKAGSPFGRYYEHIFYNKDEAIAYAKRVAQKGRIAIREDSALPTSFLDAQGDITPGNPVEKVYVVEGPPDTPYIQGVVAPQVDPAQAGRIYRGGGTQTAIPRVKLTEINSFDVTDLSLTNPALLSHVSPTLTSWDWQTDLYQIRGSLSHKEGMLAIGKTDIPGIEAPHLGASKRAGGPIGQFEIANPQASTIQLGGKGYPHAEGDVLNQYINDIETAIKQGKLTEADLSGRTIQIAVEAPPCPTCNSWGHKDAPTRVLKNDQKKWMSSLIQTSHWYPTLNLHIVFPGGELHFRGGKILKRIGVPRMKDIL